MTLRVYDADGTDITEALKRWSGEHHPAERAPYTIAEIDEAMRQIVGPHYVRVGEAGWVRPHAMLSAAAQAWIVQRGEDRHSLILRSALLDLNETGVLKPHDGIWPDE